MKWLINYSKNLIEKFKNLSFWTQLVIYAVVFILSHFSISLLLQFGFYGYSKEYDIPYVYFQNISLITLLPSILSHSINYLLFSIFIFSFTLFLLMQIGADNKDGSKHSFVKKIYLKIDKYLDSQSDDIAIGDIVRTRSGRNLYIFSLSFPFIAYLLFFSSTARSALIFSSTVFVPIYFAHLFFNNKSYILSFISIIPILLFSSSLTLSLNSTITSLLKANKIGGNIPISILTKDSSRKIIRGELILMNTKNVILLVNGENHLFNLNFITEIIFNKKINNDKK